MRTALNLLVFCVALTGSRRAVATDVQYVVSGRTDVRVRSPLSGDLATGAMTADLELLPAGEVSLLNAGFHASLLYNPSLLLREPLSLGPVVFLHRGRLMVGKRWERAHLVFTQDAAYGLTDVASLRQSDPAVTTVGEVQSLGVIPLVRSASILAVEATPSTRASWLFSGGYLLSGSPDTGAVATRTLPLQWGPTGQVRFRGRVTLVDALLTHATVFAADFVTGQKQFIVQLIESYERQLSTAWQLTAGAGIAATREVVVEVVGGPIPGDYREFLPVGTFALSFRPVVRGSNVVIAGSARLAPFADRFTASVYERAEARVQADWRVARELAMMTAAGGAYAVPVGHTDQAGDRLYFGEGSVMWSPQQWLSAGALARVMWVEQPRLGTAGQLQWLMTFSVIVRDQNMTSW